MYFAGSFTLRFRAVRKTVFDAYVRDYLSAYFSENKTVPKTVTWTGLFHQAVAWHEQIQKEEILSKLTKDFSLVTWQPICEHPRIEFGQWVFEELQSIEQIIDESRKLQHCLASSYAQRIIEGYVAFQMQHTQLRQRMTLGCIRQQETLNIIICSSINWNYQIMKKRMMHLDRLCNVLLIGLIK